MQGPSRDVVVLGAGFSHAINREMPVIDQLGDRVVHQHPFLGFRVTKAPFQDGSFEKWLSTLAEDQPYLTAGENAGNRATFVQLSGAIRTVLGSAEHRALEQQAPDWFYSLLS